MAHRLSVSVLFLASQFLSALAAVPALAQEGPGASILFWPPPQQVAGYRAMDQLAPTRTVKRGTLTYPLLPDAADLSGFRYAYGGQQRTLDDYVRAMRIAGLIAVKADRVRLERYALGNDASSRWMSFSIAKSVTSLLFGAALQDGYFSSVDDRVVDYLPRLKGSGYDGVTIEQLLHMASGVQWNEDYADPQSDVAQAPLGGLPMFAYLRTLPTAAQPGERFNYNTAETSVAGALLRAAIGNNLATYLEAKIWQPFGMEFDGSWMLDRPHGEEVGGCCIQATLRDYARLGLFTLRDGVALDGTRIVPEGWIAKSVAPSPAADHYGYFWWLLDGGRYAAIGIFGQMIWVDPERDIVIAMHSAWPQATGRDLGEHRLAFLAALADAL